VLWALISLLSIFFAGSYPIWALFIGAAGGVGVGILIWQRAKRYAIRSVLPVENWSSIFWVQRNEILISAPALLFLLFANRLPFFFSCLSIVFLCLIWFNRKASTGHLTISTPFDIPFFLFLLASCLSLYSSIDIGQSGHAICMLIAGMALFYEIVNCVGSKQRIHTAFLVFFVTGIGIALSTFWVMQFPIGKVPFINILYKFLPDLFPRRIHPNYIGGTLVFFFPIAFWGLFCQSRSILWGGAGGGIIGIGLLMTQCRGALLAVCVALLLAGTYWTRWVRWGLPFLVLAGGLLVRIVGIDFFLSPFPFTYNRLNYNIQNRFETFQQAICIVQEFPLTGIGMRSFPKLVNSSRPSVPLYEPANWKPHAHNLYLEIAVAVGFPGFVAFWIILGTWGAVMWEILARARRNREIQCGQVLGMGLACGMIAFLLYSITDAIAFGEKAGVVFWGQLGLTAVLWRITCTDDPQKPGVH
jgi:O-antigen ligase